MSDKITYSELTRTSSEAEALARANANAVVEHLGDSYADAIRDEYPDVRIFSYQLYRMLTPATAAEWDAFAGAGAEAGYCHIGGVRRKNPSTGTPGNPSTHWYVMNMGYQPYIDWQHLNTLKVAIGIRYGAPQFTYPPALDAVLIDLTLLWPDYDDVNNENIAATDEYGYAGGPEDYRHDCLLAFQGAQTYMATAGVSTIVYPNFGSIAELLRVDQDTVDLIAAAQDLILVEFAIRYDGDEPNLLAHLCEERWGLMDTMLNGTREFMCDGFILASASQENKDRAKIGIAAFMLMGYKTGLLARFYEFPEDAPGHVLTWEKNDLINEAHHFLGEPAGDYEVVSGDWETGELYHREFANGHVWLYVRLSGEVGEDPASVVLSEPAFPVNANGELGAPITAAILTPGEALIVQNVAVPTPGFFTMHLVADAGPNEFINSGVGSSQKERLTDGDDATLIFAGAASQRQSVFTLNHAAVIPDDFYRATSIVANIREEILAPQGQTTFRALELLNAGVYVDGPTYLGENFSAGIIDSSHELLILGKTYSREELLAMTFGLRGGPHEDGARWILFEVTSLEVTYITAPPNVSAYAQSGAVSIAGQAGTAAVYVHSSAGTVRAQSGAAHALAQSGHVRLEGKR